MKYYKLVDTKGRLLTTCQKLRYARRLARKYPAGICYEVYPGQLIGKVKFIW